MNLNSLIESSSQSTFGRWKLNFILHRIIPFNKPHRLKVLSINESEANVLLPYRRSNLNHLKGLHACAQTTVAEYASGLWLLYRLGAKKYRIIMKVISAEYHYQAKADAIASFGMSERFLEEQVLIPLQKEGVADIECKIEIKGKDGTHFSTVTTIWQVKTWDKVKTKV